MGTQTIITTNAIEQLEDDISELTAKLNGVITEYNLVQADMTTNKTAIDQLKTQFNLAESDLTNHKGKIDTLIIDVNNIEAKIGNSSNYSADHSGNTNGNATDPILDRIQELDEEFVGLENYVRSQHSGRSSGRGGSCTDIDELNSISALSTTSSGNASDGSAAITAGTADQSSSTSVASVTPSYATDAQRVVTLGNKSEIKARKLARQTLNRLRK